MRQIRPQRGFWLVVYCQLRLRGRFIAGLGSTAAAKALGPTIPEALLATADEVVSSLARTVAATCSAAARDHHQIR
jgi:hypothetical protein